MLLAQSTAISLVDKTAGEGFGMGGRDQKTAAPNFLFLAAFRYICISELFGTFICKNSAPRHFCLAPLLPWAAGMRSTGAKLFPGTVCLCCQEDPAAHFRLVRFGTYNRGGDGFRARILRTGPQSLLITPVRTALINCISQRSIYTRPWGVGFSAAFALMAHKSVKRRDAFLWWCGRIELGTSIRNIPRQGSANLVHLLV